MTVAPAATWFVVAQYASWSFRDGAIVLQPRSLRHAKRMGGLDTACGMNATTWHRLWELAFVPRGADACERCLAIVRDGG